MNNKERDEKFLKSWLKKKISITTSTVVSFLITGAIGGGAAYGAGNKAGTGGNNNSVAWGQGSSVDNDSVAVGANARAVSASGGVPAVTSKGVAIGNNAKAEGSISIGELSSSNHFGVAVGYKAGAQNTTTGSSFSNVTIGANTRVGVQGTQAAQGIAIGSGVQAHEGAWAKGDQSISIGANTIASGDSSIAIGGDDLLSVSTKTSSYSDAKFDKNGNKIGGNSNNTASINNIFNTLTGRGAILHQGTGTDGKFYTAWRNTESGQGAVALGVKSISGDIALAIGTFSEATGTNSVAIGTGAQTPQSGAVAIGGGSTTYGLQGRQITDADIALTDGTTMSLTNFAGASGVLEGSMVSFGKIGNERQLKNIAPGAVSATSTDGINGSQLFAVAKKLGDDISKFKYVSIKSNDAGNKLNDGATANNAIAIGPNASTKVESGVSLGDGANVLPGPTKDKAGTLLQSVITSGSGVAIGKNATATQAGVAIGDTSSTVTSGIAIGREAKVTNKYESASGPYVVGDSQDGYLNYDRVQNPDNLQYSNTEATGNDIFSPDRYNGQGIAIGYKAESNMFGTSLGNSAVAKQGGLALGTFAKAEGATATAIGLGANSSGARGISMGRQASATTADSVAIGTGARGGATSAGGSVAVGGGAAATGTQAIAIGGLYGNDLYSSSATKDGAGNLTKNTQASGEASIALGVNTKATGKQALAMGSDAQAKEEASIALGVNAVSENGIAIGKDSTSGKDASVSVGLGANSNAGGIAVGKNAKSKSATSIGIGEGAIANANSVVIGTNTNSGTGTKSVLIGDGSSVGTPTPGLAGNATGVISIGQNAGKDSAGPNLMSTINLGSNTKVGDAARTTGKVAQSIAIGSGNSPGQGAWARGDQSISIGSDTESTGDSSIAIGGDDLVNVSKANSSYSEAKFDKNGNQIGGSSNQTATINNIFSNLTGRGAILAGGKGTDGRTYKIYDGTKSGQGAVALGVKAQSGDIALAIGTMSEATGTNSVAIGTGAQALQSNAVAIGGGSTTFGIQGRQVKDADVTLADGTTMNYSGFAGADNVLEGSMVSFGREGKERQLKHIAPGEISATSTDGINGSQLYAVAKTLGEGWKADAGGNKIGSSTLTSVKPGNTVVYSAGSNLQVKQTVDATNGKQTYEYSLNKDLTGLDSVTTKTITIPGATPGTNDVVIGKDGINAGSKPITNVAPGVNGTDAVNKNQLDQKIGDNTIKLGGDKGTTGTQNLSQAGGLQFNIKGGDGLETSASGTDVTVQLDTVTKQKLNKAVLPLKFSGDDYDPFDETSTVVSKELGNKLEIVGGADTTDPTKLSNNNIGTMVDGTGKINIKLAKELKDLTSAEFKTPAGDKTVINGDGLTVTPVAPGAAPISVTKDGINAGNKTITNVAPGVNGTDAVNKNQLDQKIGDNTIKLGGNTGVTDPQNLSQTGGIKFDIVGTNGITTEAKDGKVTVSVDPSKLSAGNSKLSYTANGATPKKEVTLAQGLNFSDGIFTEAEVDNNGVVKYNVLTDSVSVDTDGKITGPTADGVATAKDVASALTSMGWKATAGTVSATEGTLEGTVNPTLVHSGEQVTFVAGKNLTVSQDVDTDGNHKYTYKLDKNLKDLDSVTSKTITVPGAPGTNDVVIGKDGINAGNKPITNVADGVNGKDAVNKSQLDKIGDNEIKLGGDNTTVTAGQKLSQTGGLKFNIKGANGIETSAAGTDVTVKLDAATRGKIDNAADKNLSNLTPAGIDKIKDTAAWKVKANSNAAETVKGGDEVVFKDGAGVTITQSGKEFTIAADTSKISKDTKISYTANGAAPKKEVSLADGFNFEDGTLTTATVDTAGKVKYDVKTTTLTSTDGKVTVPTTDGVATAKDVANAINNSGWKANAGGNVDGTSASTLVKAGDEVVFKAGDNLTVKQDLTAGKQEYTYKLNKDLTGLDSVTSKTITVPGAPGTNDVVIGKDGISAGNKVIKDVAPGVNGTDAVNKNQLDTTANNLINKGMNFSADDYDPATANTTVSKKLGERLEIVGGADKTKLSDNNIGSVVDNTGKINVKLAKELKDLTSAEFKTPAGDKTVINGDGLTVTPVAPGAAPISVTKDGINAGNKTITNVAPGVNGTDAVNKNQLDQKIGDNKIKLGGDTGTTATQDLSQAGGLQFNIKGANGIETSAAGTDVTVKLDAATRGKIDNAADKNLSNLTPAGIDKIKDTAAWKVKANSNAAETVKGGDEVVFKDGAGVTITQSGKEFTIAADTSKISKDTKISYTANGAAPKKEVSLADGFNFEDGTLTTATVDTAGKVKYDVKTTTLTSTDGKVTVPTTDGVATAKDVANAINNSGWKANAGGNVDGTSASTLVKAGDEVVFKAGDNLTVKQDLTAGKQEYTYKLNKDLTGLDSVTSKTITVPGAPGTNDVVIGKDGISAGNKVIKDVAPGVNGTDAVNKNQLDTTANNLIDKGMNFSADDYDPATANTTVSKKLGERLEIVGGADKTKLSDNNIGSVVDNTGKINVKLAKELKDLTSAEFKTPAGDKTVINGDGLTVSPATPTTSPISVTKDGISAGDKKVTNVAPGTISKTSTDAINGSQLYNLSSNTIQLGGDNASTTDKQTLDKSGGIKFDIVGANGITTEAKDGKVTVKVDSSTIGANSKLKYTANGDAPKQEVTLADGLNFKNGNFTTATVGANGEVKYDTVTQGLTVTDGKAGLPNPATPGATTPNGLVTAQDVADALNNVGWKATADSTGTGIKTGTPSAQLVKNGSTVSYVAGDNLTVAQDVTAGDHKYTYSLNKVLKDLTSAEFKTPAGDKTVINGDGLTVSPATPTTSPISVTKDGISAGDKKVTNVAPGTISKTSTDAINGSQLYNLSSNTIQLGGDNASTTDKQTLDKSGGIKFDIVGANGITTEAKDGKVTVKVDSSTIGANSKLKYTANGDAPKQEVTLADGLNFKNGNFTTATVGANGEVKYDTVTQGLTVTDGKAGLPNPATPGATTPNGLVTAQDVADALNNVGWKATADSTGTGIKTGTPSAQLVKNGSTVSYVAGDNLTVAQDVTAGDHKYTYSLNKVLKDLTSAEFKTPAGDKTVINGDGLTVSPATPTTSPISVTKDGISAGDKKVTNVAPGAISKTSTDAINGSQLYNLSSNTIQLGGDKATTTDKQTLDKNGGIKFDIVGANGITTEAKDGKVTVKVDSSTIGANSKLKYTANGDAPKQEVTLADGLNFKNGNFTTATVGANGEVKYDTVTQGLTVTDGKAGLPNPATPGATTPNGLVTAQDVANALNSVGWNATADATGTGVKTGTPSAQLVKNGSTVTYVAGNNLTVAQAVDTNGNHKYTYSLNKDLKDLDSVTTKTITVPGAPGTNDVVIGKDGISAGNKVIKDVAPGVNGTDAVNKNQLDTTANNLIDKGMNFSADDYDPATANTTVSKKLGERLEIVGGADKTKLSDNNIGSVVDNTGKINVKLAKELKDLTSAEFKTPAGDKTVINGDGLTVSPATPTTSPISVTKDGISAGDKKVTNVAPGTISKTSTDAINGSQLYNLSSNTIQLGGDKATTTDKQTLDKNGGIKFDIVGANGITTEAKDGKVTVSVDASTIGANTKLKYKSNSDAATAQEVKLSDGLDFKNGNFTTATVGANGEVKYDTVTQGLTVTDGKAGLPNPATPGATTPNGLVTAQDVADALNNVGWKATADSTGTGIKTGTPSAQLVKNGSTVSYVAGDNLTVAQDVTAGDHKYTYSLNKVLKDLTSAEFKTAAGDKTVINGDGLTVNPATPGTAPISITKDGISAGDKVVKNVAPGAISKTSTDAINGSQLYNLSSNTIQLGGDKATTTDKQTLDKSGGIKFDIVGANGITTEAKDGKVTVKVDSSTIGANAKLSYTANGAAPKQEVTLANGLDFKNGNFTTATVGANGEVKYDTVTQGLTVTDGKAGLPNPATPGATTPNGLVTAQDVADALNNVGWKATASAVGTGVASGSPSAQLVKNGSTVSYVAGDNLTVAQDVTAGDHKYTYSLNKVLKDLTSAEFKTAAGDKTVINGDGLTVNPATPGTAPISITKDGISAGDKVVKNVAPGAISKTSTDAINGSQLYNLSSNTIQLGGDKATTTDKQTLDKNGGIKFDIVGANGITTEAKDGKVTVKVDSSTIGANSKLKYTANGDAPKQEVTLADGLNFKNGNFTTATVGANGEVKYDTVTQGLTVTDGKAGLPNPATPGATTPNGLVTAQDVANALNSVGWNATASAVGTGVASGSPSAQLVKNGSTVSYVAGDNLTVAQAVDANGNHKYTYSLNKQLKDLTSAEFVNPTSGNKTVVNGDGLTITPSTPGAKNISITKDGISAGDKKITDVADGDITPTSKDAINGSQLYKLASNTIQLGGDGSTVTATQQLNKNGGIKFNIVGDNGIITEAKDDKVIVRVNPATIGSNITLKYAANGANGQTVKLSDGLNFQDGNFTKASVDTAGKVKYDTVTQAIAPTADGTAQVAPGSTPGLATSADVVNAINNSGWKATAGGNVTGTPTSTVVKNGQEVEFNAGDNLKVKQTIDPTTGKQTYEYSLNKDLTGLNSAEFTNAAGDKTKITAGNTEYTNAAGDKTVVNAGGLTISSSTPGAKDISVTKDGISAGDKVIKNVAAGVNDTDAVNVSQLKDVDNKITNVNNTINKGLNFKGNTGATVNKQLGDTLEIVGEGTKADSEYSGQNLKVVEDGGKLVVKMDKNLKSDTVTADTVNTNSVTVGAPGKDGVITVKDANGKDGVSINGKDGSIGLNGKDGSSATISTVQGNPGVAGTPGTTMDRIQYTDNSGTPHQVATLDDGMKYGGDTGAVINKKLNQQVNVVGGITDVTKLAANDNIGVVSDGSNNLKVRLAKDLDGLETVTVRDASGNTTVVKGDGVTITSPSGNTVSLSNEGLDNGGNVITNVAAGKDGTDAVNVDQLNQTVGNVVNAAGDAIAHVNNKVDKLGDRVNKGLAGAAAMAGLEFMDIGINQATVAAAVGGYRGTHAVAVGIQAAPTENTRINAKVSMTPGSRTETMYSVGASYRFNWR
ncbi:YadA-like family protein [Fusobacterium pseudoperiodonticum]|uniref:YadA-like family protein n=1 Tax=Fusobacterium pseudoperiodonticum TaxID=2663009 RepID=UPI0028EE8510|nr:YadA-like family protein [Fusobacterium pseudoperiodonticum]